jgi:broad specificity phosphatase PhoE
MQIDTIVSSSMPRAHKTAEIIKENAELTPSIQSTDLLYETLRPTVVWGKLKTDPSAFEIVKQTKEHFADPNYKHSDEENFFDLKERAISALKYVSELSGNTILVTTHAAFLKILFAVALHGEQLTSDVLLLHTRKVRVENTSISKFVFDERDGWTMISWNDHGHLLDEIE